MVYDVCFFPYGTQHRESMKTKPWRWELIGYKRCRVSPFFPPPFPPPRAIFQCDGLRSCLEIKMFEVTGMTPPSKLGPFISEIPNFHKKRNKRENRILVDDPGVHCDVSGYCQ